MKSADVEEIRLLEPGDLGLGLRVELRFEPVQRLDDRIRRLDRIRSAVRVRRVPRVGLKRDARPDDAHRDEVHASVRRLGDQRGVGRWARQHRGERAVPPALLLDHALVDEPTGERARRESRFDTQKHCRDPTLHVAGAAAVHASTGYLAPERLPRPAVGRLGADHIHMPVEDKRATAAPTDLADQRAAALIRHERDSAVRPLRQARRVGDDRLDGETELSQPRLDEQLRRLFLPEQTRNADELSEEADGGVEAALDRTARVH
jgi:hypothetical protein